jgi:sugar phosphate isomerase/epimerase
MKFGLCTPAENIPILHKLGYDFIELRGIDIRKADRQKIRDIAAMAERFSMPCSGFNSYCGKDLPIVGPDFNPAAVRAYAQDVCEKGAMLKIKTVGIGSPRARCLPDGFPADEADRQMEEFLVITAQEAAKYGQFVLLESLNTKICNYLTATPDALAMVRRMALPNLAIVLDFYHMNVMSEDVGQIAEYMPFVRHLHISGLSRAVCAHVFACRGVWFFPPLPAGSPEIGVRRDPKRRAEQAFTEARAARTLAILKKSLA